MDRFLNKQTKREPIDEAITVSTPQRYCSVLRNAGVEIYIPRIHRCEPQCIQCNVTGQGRGQAKSAEFAKDVAGSEANAVKKTKKKKEKENVWIMDKDGFRSPSSKSSFSLPCSAVSQLPLQHKAQPQEIAVTVVALFLLTLFNP